MLVWVLSTMSPGKVVCSAGARRGLSSRWGGRCVLHHDGCGRDVEGDYCASTGRFQGSYLLVVKLEAGGSDAQHEGGDCTTARVLGPPEAEDGPCLELQS